jgi:hypothetical protein
MQHLVDWVLPVGTEFTQIFLLLLVKLVPSLLTWLWIIRLNPVLYQIIVNQIKHRIDQLYQIIPSALVWSLVGVRRGKEGGANARFATQLLNVLSISPSVINHSTEIDKEHLPFIAHHNIRRLYISVKEKERVKLLYSIYHSLDYFKSSPREISMWFAVT